MLLEASTGVFLAAQFFDLIEDRAKNIGFVIGNGAGEIGKIFRALNDRGHALETHAGIDVPLRKRRKRSVRRWR